MSRGIAQLETVRQAMDIIIKNAMLHVGMKTFGKSPRTFYFPPNEQEGLMADNRELRRMMRNQYDYMPIIGLSQAVRLCEDNNFYVNSDTVVDFANREYKKIANKQLQVSLINQDRGEICGIRVNLHEYIRDERTRQDIIAKIRAIRFNVKYMIPLRPEFEKRMKDKGKTDEDINRMSLTVRMNKTMKRLDDATTEGIMWGADDPSVHKFEVKDRDGENPVTHTVASYFKERYNIVLRYPKMPLIFIGGKELFPIEFLFQRFGKLKGANLPEHVQAKLEYYNKKAGSQYVDNIDALSRQAFTRLGSLGLDADAMLRQYNLRRSNEPVQMEARLLDEPTLNFHEETRAELKNGSWAIKGGPNFKKFHGPAQMNSFVVLNLCRDPQTPTQFTQTFLKCANSHGLDVPNLGWREIENLIHTPSVRDFDRPDMVIQAFDDALQKARDFFLFDSSNYYGSKGFWHKTRVKIHGGIHSCLVIPPPENHPCREVGLIPPPYAGPSHSLKMEDGRQLEVRVMVQVRSGDKFDPFDLKYDFNARCFVHNGEVIGENRQIYVDEKGSIIERFKEVRPLWIVEENKMSELFECPSIAFVILRDEKVDHYGTVKMLGQFKYGCQTQCIVETKFKGQRSKDAYCSNVVLKVNAKLASNSKKAHAWSTHHGGHRGMPWLRDEGTPTFVMGISTSNTLGQDALSVVTASAALDYNRDCMQFAQDVRIQSRTEIIDGSILVDLTKTLLKQFLEYNREDGAIEAGIPKRMLIYRDAVSPGSFDRVRRLEIQSIRRGYLEFERENRTNGSVEPCNHCDSVGCHFCCPPITFVVCSTRNNVRMVPMETRDAPKNVYSGACIDNMIIDMSNLQVAPEYSETEQKEMSSKRSLIYTETKPNGYDFILVAHGGGLGTSKPVHYRCILNENAVWRASSSSSPLLKETLELITYQMSYQYSTAAKAVRVVPAVYYSTRLANVAMKYLSYLRNTHMERKELDDVPEEEKQFLPKTREGIPRNRFTYVRTTNDEGMQEYDQHHLQTSLVPKFSHKPFFFHMSA
jgi:hypothetical protein